MDKYGQDERPEWLRCGNCHFAVTHQISPLMGYIRCHKNPPTPGRDRGIGQFPYVGEGSWCGQFMPKEGPRLP